MEDRKLGGVRRFKRGFGFSFYKDSANINRWVWVEWFVWLEIEVWCYWFRVPVKKERG